MDFSMKYLILACVFVLCTIQSILGAPTEVANSATDDNAKVKFHFINDTLQINIPNYSTYNQTFNTSRLVFNINIFSTQESVSITNNNANKAPNNMNNNNNNVVFSSQALAAALAAAGSNDTILIVRSPTNPTAINNNNNNNQDGGFEILGSFGNRNNNNNNIISGALNGTLNTTQKWNTTDVVVNNNNNNNDDDLDSDNDYYYDNDDDDDLNPYDLFYRPNPMAPVDPFFPYGGSMPIGRNNLDYYYDYLSSDSNKFRPSRFKGGLFNRLRSFAPFNQRSNNNNVATKVNGDPLNFAAKKSIGTRIAFKK